MAELRTCHSSISRTIIFDPTRPACVTCHQKDDCSRVARDRIHRANQQRSSTSTSTSSSSSSSSGTSTYHVPSSMLRYDTLPEQEETLTERLMWNMMGAALSSMSQEAHNLFSRWKFGARSREHNTRAAQRKQELQLELEEVRNHRDELRELVEEQRKNRKRK